MKIRRFGLSAVIINRGLPLALASIMPGNRFAAAVPEVVITATCSLVLFDSPETRHSRRACL